MQGWPSWARRGTGVSGQETPHQLKGRKEREARACPAAGNAARGPSAWAAGRPCSYGGERRGEGLVRAGLHAFKGEDAGNSDLLSDKMCRSLRKTESRTGDRAAWLCGNRWGWEGRWRWQGRGVPASSLPVSHHLAWLCRIQAPSVPSRRPLHGAACPASVAGPHEVTLPQGSEPTCRAMRPSSQPRAPRQHADPAAGASWPRTALSPPASLPLLLVKKLGRSANAWGGPHVPQIWRRRTGKSQMYIQAPNGTKGTTSGWRRAQGGCEQRGSSS